MGAAAALLKDGIHSSTKARPAGTGTVEEHDLETATTSVRHDVCGREPRLDVRLRWTTHRGRRCARAEPEPDPEHTSSRRPDLHLRSTGRAEPPDRRRRQATTREPRTTRRGRSTRRGSWGCAQVGNTRSRSRSATSVAARASSSLSRSRHRRSQMTFLPSC